MALPTRAAVKPVRLGAPLRAQAAVFADNSTANERLCRRGPENGDAVMTLSGGGGLRVLRSAATGTELDMSDSQEASAYRP